MRNWRNAQSDRLSFVLFRVSRVLMRARERVRSCRIQVKMWGNARTASPLVPEMVAQRLLCVRVYVFDVGEWQCLILSSLSSPSWLPPLSMSHFAIISAFNQQRRTISCGEIVNNVSSGRILCSMHTFTQRRTASTYASTIYDLRFIYLLLSYKRQCRAICRSSLNMTVCDTHRRQLRRAAAAN